MVAMRFSRPEAKSTMAVADADGLQTYGLTLGVEIKKERATKGRFGALKAADNSYPALT
jgi:hypothetical protein